jgi:tyrosinase
MSGVPTSAFDPIFWSHHCMIDRLWHIWQNSSNAMDPPPDLLDTVLVPFPMTVAQVLDIDRMGYEYAVAAVA